jgi:hypothetical protein
MPGALTHDPMRVGGGLYQNANGSVPVDQDGMTNVLTASQLSAIAYALNGNTEQRQVGALLTDWTAGAITNPGATGTGYSSALDATVQLFNKPTLKCVFPSDASSSLEIRIGELATALEYLAEKVADGSVVATPFAQTYGELFASRTY